MITIGFGRVPPIHSWQRSLQWCRICHSMKSQNFQCLSYDHSSRSSNTVSSLTSPWRKDASEVMHDRSSCVLKKSCFSPFFNCTSPLFSYSKMGKEIRHPTNPSSSFLPLATVIHRSFSSSHSVLSKKDESDSAENDDEDLTEIQNLDDKMLKVDHDLRELLHEIKKDFDLKVKEMKSGTSNNNESDSEGLDDASTKFVSHNDINFSNNISSQSSNHRVEKDFEYDYQVADDIEEYDYIEESELAMQQVRPVKALPISLERGQTGVFDLDELLTFLEDLGAVDVVSFPVPPEANFCDHMIVVSAKSKRHLQAMNDELLWVHKRKKWDSDPHLVIEGKDKSSWCAMDMGNIVLHIFHGASREYYDIESLWTLGRDDDPKLQGAGHDPYALSPEDLFWLETAKVAGKGKSEPKMDDFSRSTVTDTDHGENFDHSKMKTKGGEKSKLSPEGITEEDAGWGKSNS